MKKMIYVFILIFTNQSYAQGIFDLPGDLGDALRSARASWSSSGSNSGIQKSFSKDDCREILEDQIDEMTPGEIYSFVYFTQKIKADDLNDSKNNVYNSPDSYYGRYLIGANPYSSLRPSSMSPEVGVHINRNCREFVKVGESQITKSIMAYPIYTNKGRTNNCNREEKTCRVTTMSIDELSYDVIFCEGDRSAYARIN